MTAPDRIRIAAAQYPLDEVQTLAAWQAKIGAWVEQGAAAGAQLLVFPEYGLLELAAIKGAEVTQDLQATLGAAADLAVEACAHMAGLAARHGVHILAPSGPVRDATQFRNRAALIAPSGGIGRQDKLMMTPFERQWGVTGGSDLVVHDTALGRIGVAICYDSEFPLLVRALTEAGAEIVLVPSCTEHASGSNRVQWAARARALESQVVTVVAPLLGPAPWCAAVDRNTGAAGLYVPPEAALSMTGVLEQGEVDEPCWVLAEVDLALVRQMREAGEMRNRQDWAQQPGATPLAPLARVVRLI